MRVYNTKFIFKGFNPKRQKDVTAADDQHPLEFGHQPTAIPTDAMKEKLLDDLVVLGLVTAEQKESATVVTVCAPEDSAIVLFWDPLIYNIHLSNLIKKWLLDNEVEHVIPHAPDDNCIFITMKGIQEIDYLIKTKVAPKLTNMK